MIDLFTLFTSRFEAVLYGEPRLTHDIDLVVLLDDDSIDALVSAFPDEEFDCAPEEAIRVEARRAQRGHFNIIHHESGFKADVYIAGRDPLNGWALRDRRRLTLGETTLSVAPPEYVIVRKLEFFREGGSAKHLQDIRGILQQQVGKLDSRVIEEKVAELGLADEWRRASQAQE